jgi:hypothetical protein
MYLCDAALAVFEGPPLIFVVFLEPPWAGGAASGESENCTRARLLRLPFDPSVSYPDMVVVI